MAQIAGMVCGLELLESPQRLLRAGYVLRRESLGAQFAGVRGTRPAAPLSPQLRRPSTRNSISIARPFLREAQVAQCHQLCRLQCASGYGCRDQLRFASRSSVLGLLLVPRCRSHDERVAAASSQHPQRSHELVRVVAIRKRDGRPKFNPSNTPRTSITFGSRTISRY